MSSKKWFVTALSALFSAIVVFALFNVTVDPFGAFGSSWYSYNMTSNPRVSKIAYLKENHEKYDSYIVGCSSTSSYPVKELNAYTGASFYNMIVYGADMLDTEREVYYLVNNYEVKNIVVNIYIANGDEYDTVFEEMTMSSHPLTQGGGWIEFYTRYLFANPNYAIDKIKAKNNDRYLTEPFDVFDVETGAYDKRKRDAEKVSDIQSFYKDYPAFLYYPNLENAHLDKYRECAESLGRIKAFCEENGVNIVFINSPVYHERFNDYPRDEIRAFYKAMAENVDFWDFSQSSISFEPRYFYDETHLRNDVGRMALARVFGDDSIYVPDDFGIYVTSDNVDSVLNSVFAAAPSDKAYEKKLSVLRFEDISEENLERHLSELYSLGYTGVCETDVTDYIDKGTPLPEKPVLILIDSLSNRRLEILEKYGFSALSFDQNCYPSIPKENPANLSEDRAYIEKVKTDYASWKETYKNDAAGAFVDSEEIGTFLQNIFNECGIRLSFSTNPKADTLVKGIKLSGYGLGTFEVNDNTSIEALSGLLNS